MTYKSLVQPPTTSTLEEYSQYCSRLARLKFPAQTVLLADGISYGTRSYNFSGPPTTLGLTIGGHIEFRHHGDNSLNVLYADGHGASIPSTLLPGLPSSSGTASRFWYGTSDGKSFANDSAD